MTDTMPLANVVLFGPAHAGKSTLSGYLKYREDPVLAEQEISRVERSLGSKFDPAQALAYLVDKSQDERVRTHSGRLGTSKRLHITETAVRAHEQGPLINFVTVDTPGAEHAGTQRLRGMFYGEIGVFCVEVDNLSNYSGSRDAPLDRNLISVLLTWTALRPQAPLVFALTKADQIGWNSDVIKQTISYVRKFVLGSHAGTVTALSIDVKGRSDRNVMIAESFEENPGSLLDLLSIAVPEVRRAGIEPQVQSARQCLFAVYKLVRREGLGISCLGKTISGEFRVGDKVSVILHSAKSTNLVQDQVREATIRQIEKSGTTRGAHRLEEGELGGLIVSGAGLRGIAVEDSTSMIISDSDTKFTFGRFVELTLPRSASHTLHAGEEVALLWLGRSISVRIFDMRDEAHSADVNVLVGAQNAEFAFCLPEVDRSQSSVTDFRQVVLARPSGRGVIGSAGIVKLGKIDAVRLRRINPEILATKRTVLSYLKVGAAGEIAITNDEFGRVFALLQDIERELFGAPSNEGPLSIDII